MNYSIKQFKKDFPSEEACLDYIFKSRFPGIPGNWYKVKGRKCYADSIGFQIHPLADTIFHKSDTPLTLWFFAIYLFAGSKNGVSAKELQHHLGCTYKTAWRIGSKIRSLMTQGKDLLGGIVEADETYVGGVKKGVRGLSKDKTPVLGIVQRKGGVRAKVSPDGAYTGAILNNITDNVSFGSRVVSDDNRIYRKVKRFGMFHDSVNHSKQEYVRGDVHTNTIEGFWSQMKRSIDGTYHAVSEKHLQSYVDEFAYRYSHRHSERPLFLKMLDAVVGRPYGGAQRISLSPLLVS